MAMRAIAQEDPVMLVWWATEVECVSAIARLERQDDLSSDATLVALERLDALAEGWSEVQPVQAARRSRVACCASTASVPSMLFSSRPPSSPQKDIRHRWRSSRSTIR